MADDDTASSSPRGRPSTRSTGPEGLFSRLRKPDVPGLRELRGDAPEAAGGTATASGRAAGIPRPGTRGKRVLKWVGIAAAGWIAAQLPRLRRLRPAAGLQALRRSEGRPHGNPLLLPSAQTILVLGTDARPPDTKEPGAAPSEECFEQQAHGDAPHDDC